VQPLPFPTPLRLTAENLARGADHTLMVKGFVDHLVRSVAATGWKETDTVLPVPRAAYEEEPPLPAVP
jgi:hypothetical protein